MNSPPLLLPPPLIPFFLTPSVLTMVNFSLLHFLSLALLLLSITLSFIQKLLRPKHIHGRGPTSYPIIGCLIQYYQNRHRLLDWYTHLISQSPTLTIIVNRFNAPRIIITANPDNVEYILKTNFHNYPKGKPFTELLGDFLGMGIFNVDGELWTTQRKLASHEFSTKSLREFVVNVLEEEVRVRLLPLLDEAAQNGSVLDLQDILRMFAFDTICKIAVGTDPCCLDLTRPVPVLVSAFDTAAQVSALRSVAPVQATWKIKRIFNLGSEAKLKEAIKVVHAFVNDIINKRKTTMEKINEKEENERDLLSRFISAGIGDEMVKDLVTSFLMAGRDTTSAAMTWLFWLMTCHRSVEKEAVEEVMLAFNDVETAALGFDDLKKMNYIKACLCESMRLYPPVAWDSKHAGDDDVLPDGTVVYKGNRVTYLTYGMGRMEEIWGKDCLEFRPDRWFDEPGILKLESPYKFPVFHAGPRVCIGKEMAFIQMKYVIASILTRFKFESVSLDKPIFVPLLTAHMAGGFKVKVYKRSD